MNDPETLSDITRKFMFKIALNTLLYYSLAKIVYSMLKGLYNRYIIGEITYNDNLYLAGETILLASILYLINSNKYLTLPFLGETVIPITSFVDTKIPIGYDSEYILDLPNSYDGMKVIYWGAKKDDKEVHPDPYDAYDKYENVGVVAVKDKKAILKYIKPVEYKAFGNQLPRHLHYRLCCKNNVMLSEVTTINLI